MILSPLLIISACTTPEPKTITQTRYVEKDIPTVSRPRSVDLNDVEFFVVTEENYEEFKEKFLNKNKDLVFIAISVKDYENLSLNISELKRYIEQQKEVIIYYEKAVK
jgi:hypothetical protein